ncbi:type II secretion system F family protein [Ketobacter sp. MCCC 1A13808]|uniref:type II secretion system F family protein n=1 Tax=Ketobacter sp. MCCC 1A13808 TaxID=2602738 RepID=UPI0012EC4B64|nr:type II secretion system F family protein [Ketobacter sp. MCCC 1A13808]MVF12527.1 type II secretion system F family protein [Ketobacter sp. MCCC 1A13808]
MKSLILEYSSILLTSLALAVGAFALIRLFLMTRPKEDEDWRDPPPLIYKIFKPVVRLFSGDIRSIIPEKTYEKIQVKLSTGGMNYAIMTEEFFTLKLICLVVGIFISYVLFSSSADSSLEVKMVIIGIGPLGYFYPDIWLNDKIKGRRRRVAKEFPFLLDLLVLSMRAGLNYSTSLGQAISNLPEGPVKEEFGKLLREIRAGKIRRDALTDLAKRMNIKSIFNFVAALNQAEETGGEIVDVLTMQAEQRRVERFNEAEAAANKAPVKMLLPLVMFLFPIIFMLIAFVLVVKMAETGFLPDIMMKLLMS